MRIIIINECSNAEMEFESNDATIALYKVQDNEWFPENTEDYGDAWLVNSELFEFQKEPSRIRRKIASELVEHAIRQGVRMLFVYNTSTVFLNVQFIASNYNIYVEIANVLPNRYNQKEFWTFIAYNCRDYEEMREGLRHGMIYNQTDRDAREARLLRKAESERRARVENHHLSHQVIVID